MMLAHVPSWLADRKALNENKMTRCIYILRALTMSVSRWLSAIPTVQFNAVAFWKRSHSFCMRCEKEKTSAQFHRMKIVSWPKMCYRVMWCSSFSIKIEIFMHLTGNFPFFFCIHKISVSRFFPLFFSAYTFKTVKRSAMNEGERMQKSTRKIEVGR